MAVHAIVHNPDVNGGRPSPEAIDAINRYAASCYQQLESQVRGQFESGLRSAADYGVAGAIGGGLGLAGGSTGFEGVDPASYGQYGAIAGAAQGAASGFVNGQVTGSYSFAAARGECVNDFWSDEKDSRPEYRGTHPVTLLNGRSGSN
ncbi:MAG TPA: hypothetical protein VEA92_02140 [Candidatus Paceibacterota bacterium]|nr:hypothetical protein [Candidatus Paceibacterota bacterium]